MARTPSGKNVLDKAKQLLSTARTADELRQAQAVILPLEFGFSLDQTAAITGVSKGWACHLRTEFIRFNGEIAQKSPQGGRRRENLSRTEETDFLAPFIGKAKAGGILIVTEIKEALQVRLGRAVALASVYNLLHRHDWRKLAPDKRHPKSDMKAQEDWKKNSQKSSSKSTVNGREKDRSS